MKRNKDFWSRIEDEIGEELPSCLKDILNECGYNSSLSFLDFDSTAIDSLEDYIEENLKDFVKDLDFYKEQPKFKFLHGHKRLLLNLSRIVHELDTARKQFKEPMQEAPKQRKAKMKISGRTQTIPLEVQPTPTDEQTEHIVASDEEVQLTENVLETENLNRHQLSSDDFDDTLKCIDDLRDNLLQKIIAFGTESNLSFLMALSSRDIDDVHYEIDANGETSKMSCKVICPLCHKKQSVVYSKKYWNTSNIYKHFKLHKCFVSVSGNDIGSNQKSNSADLDENDVYFDQASITKEVGRVIENLRSPRRVKQKRKRI